MSVSLSSSVAHLASAHSLPLPPCLVSIHLSLLCSGVRPVYANNRVPVLQRCGGQKEPLSPGHGARDGGRGASHGGPKDGARKVIESEGGHCVPPTLTPAKGYPEERACHGFGPTRKRPLGLKTDQDDTEREEGERVSHQEKRAKISTGENFLNMPCHSYGTSIFLKSSTTPLFICLPCFSLILPLIILFPSSCVMLSPFSSLVIF